MAAIDLNEAELNLLKELLQGDLARLLLEIAHTDHRSMREGLQKREGTLKGVIDKLS